MRWKNFSNLGELIDVRNRHLDYFLESTKQSPQSEEDYMAPCPMILNGWIEWNRNTITYAPRWNGQRQIILTKPFV